MNLVIFDFFGVLGGELSPRFFRNHFTKEEASSLKDKYFIPADLGELTMEETLHAICNDYGFKYDDVMNEYLSYRKPNTELFDYILKLRKNNKTALLSNAAHGIFDLFYPLDRDKYFDKAFVSAEHGMIKPNLEFYLKCINSFDEKFDNIYFIDDNIKNVEHVHEIGVNGIQFKNNEELFKILDKIL